MATGFPYCWLHWLLCEKKLLANEKIFLSSLGKKINHIPSTSALFSSLFLVEVVVCFAEVSKKAQDTHFSCIGNEPLNKTKKVYLNFFMELTFMLLVCIPDKNVILFALYCHSSVCADLQGLYLHNIHWSSRNTWSGLCNKKTFTFTNFPCFFFFNTAGYFTLFHRSLSGGEFCLTNIQFSLLSQLMHRINLNRNFY